MLRVLRVRQKGLKLFPIDVLVATGNKSSSPGRLSDLDMNGNIQPSGRMSTSAPVEQSQIYAGDVDDSLHLTYPGNIKNMVCLYKLL